MAGEEGPEDEMTITVPLRRLLTGVPRTHRAAASIPRIKRFVQRHVKEEWWRETEGRIVIDDVLNKTLWRRGREHIAGPEYWIGKKGEPKRLARRSPVRYGSVLKVRVLYVEPRDGDPFLELRLPEFEDLKRERREERQRKESKKPEEKAEPEEGLEEGAEEERPVGAEEKETEAPAEEKKKETEEKPAAEPAKKAEPKTSSKSAAAKGGPKGTAKPEAKKPAAKPKKEGGD